VNSEAADLPWKAIYRRAEVVLERVMRRLPAAVREEVRSVPVILEQWPDDELDPDTMGYYLNFEEGMVSDAKGPIILYLGSIFLYCDEEGLDFSAEIERTYLHELGHHLGFGEEDLQQRDLD
jgi:predicted Zn-dependent protease with MMP-like domain